MGGAEELLEVAAIPRFHRPGMAGSYRRSASATLALDGADLQSVSADGATYLASLAPFVIAGFPSVATLAASLKGCMFRPCGEAIPDHSFSLTNKSPWRGARGSVQNG